MFNIKTRELEFKYLANDIKLADFKRLCAGLNPERVLEVGSTDIYYSSRNREKHKLNFDFLRFRTGDKPELTLKIKSETSNNDRTEVDLPLRPTEDLNELVESYCQQLGFEENFRIFKSCFIYFFEKTDFVYYVVYNKEMKEVGRFIEVEARKDYPFKTKEEAYLSIKDAEKSLEVLGITAANRTRNSQWDRWREF